MTDEAQTAPPEEFETRPLDPLSLQLDPDDHLDETYVPYMLEWCGEQIAALPAA